MKTDYTRIWCPLSWGKNQLVIKIFWWTFSCYLPFSSPEWGHILVQFINRGQKERWKFWLKKFFGKNRHFHMELSGKKVQEFAFVIFYFLLIGHLWVHLTMGAPKLILSRESSVQRGLTQGMWNGQVCLGNVPFTKATWEAEKSSCMQIERIWFVQ